MNDFFVTLPNSFTLKEKKVRLSKTGFYCFIGFLVYKKKTQTSLLYFILFGYLFLKMIYFFPDAAFSKEGEMVQEGCEECTAI